MVSNKWKKNEKINCGQYDANIKTIFWSPCENSKHKENGIISIIYHNNKKEICDVELHYSIFQSINWKENSFLFKDSVSFFLNKSEFFKKNRIKNKEYIKRHQTKINTHILIGTNGLCKSIFLKNKKQIEKNQNKNTFLFDADFSFNEKITGKGEIFKDLNEFISNIFVFNYEIKRIEGEQYEKKYSKIDKNLVQKFKNWKKDKDVDFVENCFFNILSIDQNQPNKNKNPVSLPFVFLNELNLQQIQKISGGSGQKLYTFLLFLFEFIETGQKQGFLMNSNTCLYIDEPERLCHPSLIIKITKFLFKLSQKINLRIVTHSPLLINSFFQLYKKQKEFNKDQKTKIFKFTNNNFDKKLIIKKEEIEGKDYEIIERNKNSFKNFFISSSEFSDYLNSVIAIPNISLNFFKALFSEKIFLVEGQNDWFFIEELILQNDNQFNYQIIPCWSKTNIPKIFGFLSIFFKLNSNHKQTKHSENKRFFIFYDKDLNKNKDKHKDWNEKIENFFNESTLHGFEYDLEGDLLNLSDEKPLYKFITNDLLKNENFQHFINKSCIETFKKEIKESKNRLFNLKKKLDNKNNQEIWNEIKEKIKKHTFHSSTFKNTILSTLIFNGLLEEENELNKYICNKKLKEIKSKIKKFLNVNY